MVLLNAASDFFARFGVGTLMALTLVQEPELKRSFYLFVSSLAGTCVVLSLFFGGWPAVEMGTPGFTLLLCLPFVLGFYALYALEWRRLARASLLAAVALGLAGLLGKLSQDMTGLSWTPAQIFIARMNLVAALCLGGIVVSTLLMGHWYLISPKLSFKPLVRGALLFFAAAWLRLIVLAAVLIAFGWAAGMPGEVFLDRLFSWNQWGMFFLLRVFWGIVGPLILSFMVYKTAQIQSNQSATGILYVALVFVLIGELIADYLWALARIPL